MNGRDRERIFAEVFDALEHPMRLRILKILDGEALGFAELKRGIGIESSGHLQHHLNKLSNLIHTDDQGRYILSDDGRDALLTVENVERTAGAEKTSCVPRLGHPVRVILTVTLLFLAATTVVAFIGAMYVTEPVYRYEALNGNLEKPVARARFSPVKIPPKETLNFTNVVGPPTRLFIHEYYRIPTSILLPESNETFRRLAYVVFKVIKEESNNTWKITVGRMTGPDGSAWVETFRDPSNFPPYKNGPQKTQTYGLLADMEFGVYKIMPIATYGDYSLSLTNAGNTTINMVVETWSTEITINTSFLDENPDVTLYDPVRIREETKTYLKPLSIDVGLFLISVAILAVLSVYLVNAPLPKMGVFSSSSHTKL